MSFRYETIGSPNPCFAWDGSAVVQSLAASVAAGESRPDGWEGAFAGVVRACRGDGDEGAGGEIVLARDPLGLNKLFWAPAGDGIELAPRPSLLTDRGHELTECAAVPPNTIVTYHPGAAEPILRPAAPSADDLGAVGGAVLGGVPRGGDAPAASDEPVEKIARRIRVETARYVGAALAARPGPAVVCLSGGLDSTSVAALVREHRDDVVAVSFDLARPGRRHRSDDFDAATAAARHLGLKLIPAIHEPASLLELLDTVLVAGIDWRDFNVHAGLVNAGLARSIGEIMGGRPEDVTVFTGDLVNELVADYHDETYKGRTYYRLPRLSPVATRAALVRGLATSHREIGVFGAFGLPVVQPYAVARRDFLRLPPEVLDPHGGKQELYRLMFGPELPASSYHRPKTRAQIGFTEPGAGAGVLGLCIDAGLDAPWLERRFADLHNVSDISVLRRFLRAGRYRTAIPRGTP